jgi:hypothetical protein
MPFILIHQNQYSLMQTLQRLFILILALSCWSNTGLAQMVFHADLSGRSEVPSIISQASGEVMATLDGNELTVTGTFTDLSSPVDTEIAGGAHLHLGYAGQNGPVEIVLTPNLMLGNRSGTFDAADNTFTLTQMQMDALMARQMYVNIHTTNFGGGELRGQVLPQADATYTVQLSGSNEVPSIISNGSGQLALDLVGNELTVSGAFSGMDADFDANVAGGAHLHLGMPGENGPVDILLNATVDADLRGGLFAPFENTFTLTEAQIEALAAREYYVNIHTTAFPGGELRGQVTDPAALVVFRSHLSGSNEVPAVTSYATGVVQGEYLGDTVIVYGTFSDLESGVNTDIAGGAHLHAAPAGLNGPIAFGLDINLDGDGTSGSFAASENQFLLTNDQEELLLNRGMYVNIHTFGNQSGELRGQMLPEAQAVFTGVLGGIFEAPLIYTTAVGAVKAELRGNELVVSGAFDGLSSPVDLNIAGGAHLHLGYAGQNGGIEFLLDSQLDMDMQGGQFMASANTFELTDEQVAAVTNRTYYVNIHTTNFGGGELRGQLLQEARYYLNAPLSGTSEVPAANSPATGQVIMEVESDNIVSTGSFAGLASPFDPNVAGGAHLHDALAGANGGILEGLNASLLSDNAGIFTSGDNTVMTSEELRGKLRERGVYVNIHTEDFQAGEIRGQVLPIANAYLTTSLDAFNEVPPAMSDAVGGLKLEMTGNMLTLTGAFSGLTGEFDASIGGGAHLHLGFPGENGGVDIPINATLEAGNMTGSFLAADNQFELTAEQMANLMVGRYYANIHTTAFQAGELRGQILPSLNFFPADAPEILTPVPGSALLLEGAATTPFIASWTEATDEDSLAYVWQLSTTEDFETIAFQQNVGGNNFFEADFGTVDGLLASLGVAVGQEVTVYHRAVATDGAVSTFGEVAAVTITRGQIFDDVFSASLSGHNEALPIATMASGTINAAINGNELTVSGFFDNLSSKVDVNIVGGAHLHAGYAGENGPVLYPLTIEFDQDSLGGAFIAEDNVFELSDEELELLQGRQVYVNIHTLNFGGGELRGQLTPSAAVEKYSMSLLGSNEAPQAITAGQGALILELSDDSLTVSGAFSNMTGDFNTNIGAHLHIGAAGENGPVEIPLNPTLDMDLKGGVFAASENTFPLTEEIIQLMENRQVYANIHTTAYPAGELRGQLVSEAAQVVFRAHLSGSNEMPVVTSMAGGAVVVELMNDSVLVVTGTYSDLESGLNEDIVGGAHIHTGMPGENGDVIIPLSVFAADANNGRFLTEDNTYTVTPEQARALMGRGLYVNIHSLEEARGEIRGQLMLESQTVFSGFLSGIFGVPEVTTTALGGIKAELSGSRMTFVGTFDGLSSPVATDIAGGAHIHAGYAGETGGVIIPLAINLNDDNLGGRFPAMMNTYELTEGQADTMRARGYYVNIHSTELQAGELRTQILPEARTYFYAPLSGASEVPAVNTVADGALAIEVYPGRVSASGSFNNLGSMLNTEIVGGAHIHAGYAGQNGPVANVLSSLPNVEGTSGIFTADDNTFEVSNGWIDTLRSRSYYVNVHSIDEAAGEVRGQLLPLATTYFTNSLSGFNEVQPIMTDALGGVKIEVSNGEMVLTGAFSGLSSAFNEMIAGGAHLHIAGPGANGDVDVALMPNLADDELSGIFRARDNTFPITEAQEETLRAGQYYVNIHSVDFPSGELRGQVLPEINRFPSADATITAPADGAMLTVQGEATTPFAATWEAAMDRDDLAYIWQLSADESFSTLLVEQNVADALTFETTFGVVDLLLDNAGVAVGESVTLYHRALASDGSVATPGAAFEVVLTRGMVVSNIDIDAAGLSMKAYPTITQDNVTVELNSNTAYEGQLVISNSNGQVVNIRPVDLSAGTITEQLDASRYAAGTYQVQLLIGNQRISTSRFIKK